MRHIFTALFCISLTVNALAADVTKNNAAKVAKNYFSGVLVSNGQNHEAVISESFDITKDGNTVLYVFNFERGGYVIVSADDRFTPVIGYSPDGYYETGNMAGGFEFFIEDFSDMIVWLREKNVAAEPKYTEKWKHYESDNFMPNRGHIVRVAPMTALWNQDYPYNYYAPIEAGGRAYAGCVATAMSMIMYYWRWPWQGTGEKTYTPPKCEHGTIYPALTAKFGETIYDYNGMFGTPTIKADNYLYEPIALLQYHAGIAVEMGYCKSGSGTQSTKVPAAMIDYFKYDPSIKHVSKGGTSNDQWADMLREQLDLKQPVYASGCDNKPYPQTGCHAFVCDGYSSDEMWDDEPLFHYNFGWSGGSNAYFGAEKPGGDYSNPSNIAAVINFIPDRSKGYPDCNKNHIVTHLKGMIEDCGPLGYSAGTTSTWLIDPSLAGDAIESITITCNKMDIAGGDYIRIYDGDSDKATRKLQHNGKELFGPITTGSKAFITFTSAAGSPTANGFAITYEAKAKKDCDPNAPITLTAASGTFTDGSPDDMNYANNSICKWYIYPEGAVDTATITFNFTRLDTEAEKDEIKFYDHANGIVATKYTFSGTPSELPQAIMKTKGVMITFNSNAYINGKGFEIEYSTYPEPIVNIKEVENINDLSIYPNPTTDKLNIKFNTSTADNFDIAIYNVTGQVVYRESLNDFIGSYYNELNIADFAQGIYLMQIKSSKGAITRKVVVQ